ncbi:CDP-alcohol phosphatidyltransferase family protein, partial [Streptomyces sp. NPDC059506]|uniref:CDP-alcohol phosphatidyltransferase family protein n=1 Tax=Streptomyces sp. NPDC059506 TaxID=3347751 RepID=UPI00369CDDE5
MSGVPASGAPSGATRGLPRPAAVAVGPRRVSLWNVANLLTMMRLVLVPVFVLLLVHDGGHDPVWRAFAWAALGGAQLKPPGDTATPHPGEKGSPSWGKDAPHTHP